MIALVEPIKDKSRIAKERSVAREAVAVQHARKVIYKNGWREREKDANRLKDESR